MKAAESLRLWQRVIEVYGRRLQESSAAAECLRALNITDRAVLAHFQAGYSDGSLPNLLPKSGEAVEALRAQGLLNTVGEETLSGAIVVPISGPGGAFRGFCSIGVQTTSEPTETLVPTGAEGLVRGVLAKDGTPLVLTNRVLDAFALCQAGCRNVVAVLGPTNHAPDLVRSIPPDQRRNLSVCFTGGPLAQNAIDELTEKGATKVSVVRWPEPYRSARDFLASHSRADLEALLFPAGKGSQAPFDPAPDGLSVCFHERHYQVRAIQKRAADRLAATIRATDDQGRFVVDTIDFYHSRTRRSFVAEAARLWRQPLEVIEEDLGRLTTEVEAYIEPVPKGRFSA